MKRGYVLAADVGATWTKVALYHADGSNRPKQLFSLSYKSQEVKSILLPVKDALKLSKSMYKVNVKQIGLGVAGIVDYKKNECWLTNGKFWIKATDLKKLGLRKVVMHNDFVANGYAIPLLKKNELVTLPHPGNKYPKPLKKENKACIGAGSGLGHCVIGYDNSKWLPLASEAGHVDFPAMNNFEVKLVDWYKKKFKMPAFYESFVSGQGIVNLYMFLRQKRLTEVDKKFDKIKDVAERSKFITKYYKKDKLLEKAVKLFVKFYARAARNFALAVLAKGGVYIAGGIAPNLVNEFKQFGFVKEFEKNKTYHEALKNMPVYIVNSKEIGLLGAAVSELQG